MNGQGSLTKNSGGAWHRPRKMWSVVVAWIGAVIVVAASVPIMVISREWLLRPQTAGRTTEGAFAGLVFGVMGLLPALVGGFVSKSRPAAFGIIAAGAIYLLAFVPWVLLGTNTVEWVTTMPPGVVCLTCGNSLLVTRHRGWWFAFAIVAPVLALVGSFAISDITRAP